MKNLKPSLMHTSKMALFYAASGHVIKRIRTTFAILECVSIEYNLAQINFKLESCLLHFSLIHMMVDRF